MHQVILDIVWDIVLDMVLDIVLDMVLDIVLPKHSSPGYAVGYYLVGHGDIAWVSWYLGSRATGGNSGTCRNIVLREAARKKFLWAFM